MRVKSYLLLFCLGFCRFGAAQDLALVARIDTASTFIAVDKLDNTYLITPKDELLKYNDRGKLMWHYSNKAFGKPEFIDASDPLRTLLFYPGFQQIIILNTNLSEIARYRFSDMSRQVTLAALGNTSGYWYFDQANFELHRLGNNFEDLQQSGNLYQALGKPIQPNAIAVSEQFVYLQDPKVGILQFDSFGAYVKTILTDSMEYFQPRDSKILFARKQVLVNLNPETFETTETSLPVSEGVVQASAGSKIFALRTDKSVYLYVVK